MIHSVFVCQAEIDCADNFIAYIQIFDIHGNNFCFMIIIFVVNIYVNFPTENIGAAVSNCD